MTFFVNERMKQVERKECVSLFYLRLDLKPSKPLPSSNTIYLMLL